MTTDKDLLIIIEMRPVVARVKRQAGRLKPVTGKAKINRQR